MFDIFPAENGIYVDGKRKGSVSRFINHSCDPNCELVRWNVKGYTRIGIFALRDIAPGEPLSYDYQFDTQEQNTFKCACGKASCRGTMAPKTKHQRIDWGNLSKGEKSKMIAAERQKAKASETKLARSLTGKYLPGDSTTEVRSGPTRSIFSVARERKIFLPRCARAGSKLLSRREMMRRRAPKSLIKIDSGVMRMEQNARLLLREAEQEQMRSPASKKRKNNAK